MIWLVTAVILFVFAQIFLLGAAMCMAADGNADAKGIGFASFVLFVVGFIVIGAGHGATGFVAALGWNLALIGTGCLFLGILSTGIFRWNTPYDRERALGRLLVGVGIVIVAVLLLSSKPAAANVNPQPPSAEENISVPRDALIKTLIYMDLLEEYAARLEAENEQLQKTQCGSGA